MNEKYIINLATSALISYFDNGYEYTQVIEGEDIFIIRQSPDDIVKASFLYMGSSVVGAIESARLILKKRYMLPIGLSVKHNIFLIRCHAKCKPGTVYGAAELLAKHGEVGVAHGRIGRGRHLVRVPSAPGMPLGRAPR